MHQLLAVKHRQHRQQLAQQQHHLASPEHQLPFEPGLAQLPIGAAHLPFAHQPEAGPVADHPAEPRHLGVEHPLQLGPEPTDRLRVVARSKPAQGHRRVGSQPIAGTPELTQLAVAEALLEAVAIADQGAGIGHRRRGRAHRVDPAT